MVTKKQKKIIAGLLILALGIFLISHFNLLALFQPSPKFFVQYTGRLSGSPADAVISNTVTFDNGINTWKFITYPADTITKKFCKTLPSGATNAVQTYTDEEGCQHWSYDIPGTPAHYVWTDGNVEPDVIICLNPYYSTSFPTAICYQPKYLTGIYSAFQYNPGTPDTHIDDFGGVFYQDFDPETGNVFWGCYEKVEVYKNDILIDTFDSEGNPSLTYYDDGTTCPGQCTGKSGISFYIQYKEWVSSTKTCNGFQNVYNMIFPEESFNIDIISPEPYYIQGENIKVNIEVMNNLIPMGGTLITNYQVPTILGKATKTLEQGVSVNLGNNIYNYSIPTTEPTRILEVQPTLLIKYPTSKISGVNYNFESGLEPINRYSYIELGKVEEGWKEIQVIPKPLYYLSSGPCSEGYTLNKDGTYCISNGIADLSCVITGCPEGYTPPYECTSSGYCAQTIFTPKSCQSDSDCPAETTCDTGSGYCVNTVIYELVVQCSSASDCLSPCEGVTVSCENRKCMYSGECAIKQCLTEADCDNLEPCVGVDFKCENNQCIKYGKCLEEPKQESIWVIIQQIWDAFWSWVRGLF